MKTHRIILPAEWHALALRGVSRLLLPMRPQPVDPLGGAIKGTSIRDGGSKAALWTLDRIHICPYRAGDRLALLEPWDSYEKEWFAYKEGYPEGDRYFWKPASRMPLAACRCFYRVVSVEPVRISEISEAHARECGFEPTFVMDAASFIQGRAVPNSTYRNGVSYAWREVGRSGEDWAWSVRVEKEKEGK